MTKTFNSVYTSLKLVAILVAAAVATGCTGYQGVATPEETTSSAPDTSWTVGAGDHLWGIAGYDEVYSVPEQWPLIYKANQSAIKDADLIYPGQVLDIPRDASQSDIDAAVNHAQTRGDWVIGESEASDQAYLGN